MSTWIGREALRDDLVRQLAAIDRELEAMEPVPSPGPVSRVMAAKSTILAALVNLEHLEHSITASREHEAQGAELLAMFKGSTVAPGDFGQAMVVLAQVVSYLEDRTSAAGASSPTVTPFELDRSDRDTESAARLLGFLDGDFYGAETPAEPDTPERIVNRFLWDEERIYHAISVIRHGRAGLSDHDDESFARDLVAELTGLDYAGRPAEGTRRETSPDDAAAIADAEGGFVPGVDFAAGGPMPDGERATPEG